MGLLEGILCVDKPEGFTSFDVVAKLRGITRTKKIGHAGTLDPMATGVLPLFFGRATKAIDLLPNHDKAYEAGLKLGITTDTQDITGRIVSQKPHGVTAKEVERALMSFSGEIWQIPPMYSAVKVNGRRLYDIARSGGEADVKPRKITVYSIELAGADEDAGAYKIKVACSRGTYVRTICHDLGQALGCGAAMTSLRRTAACGFTLSDCLTLEEAQALSDKNFFADKLLPVGKFLPIGSAFSGLEAFVLDEAQAKRFCCGLELGLYQFAAVPENGTRLRVLDGSGRFLGLAEIDRESSRLKIIKIFALN